MTTFNRQQRVFVVRAAATEAGFATSGALVQTMVTEADLQAEALGYVSDATKTDSKRFPSYGAGRACSNCELHQGEAGDAVGNCPLFISKIVSSWGWCSARAEKG